MTKLVLAQVFEDRLAEAMPDGVSRRDVPRTDRTERSET
jgi:hypothetical protein